MKVIIIGCTDTGMIAATRILKNRPGTEVILYDRRAIIPSLPSDYSVFNPLGLHNSFPTPVPMISPESLIAAGAKIKTGNVVVHVDPQAKTVKALDMLTDKETVDHYDKLIIANDPLKVVPTITGIDSFNIVQFNNQRDLKEILAASLTATQVIVIGNDVLSLGLVDAYQRQQKAVTLISDGQPLLHDRFAKEYSHRLAKLLAANKVKVVNAKVDEFANNGLEVIVKTNQGNFTADKVAISVGQRPDTDLYQGILKQADNGTLIADTALQTSNKDIYVAGGSALVHYNPANRKVYAPTTAEAVRQALIVAAQITGQLVDDLGTQLSVSLKSGETTLAAVGLTEEAARQVGINADSVMIEDNYRPEFMSTNATLLMNLIWNKDNH